MDVHPPKNGINRYWFIAMWQKIFTKPQLWAIQQFNTLIAPSRDHPYISHALSKAGDQCLPRWQGQRKKSLQVHHQPEVIEIFAMMKIRWRYGKWFKCEMMGSSCTIVVQSFLESRKDRAWKGDVCSEHLNFIFPATVHCTLKGLQMAPLEGDFGDLTSCRFQKSHAYCTPLASAARRCYMCLYAASKQRSLTWPYLM